MKNIIIINKFILPKIVNILYVLLVIGTIILGIAGVYMSFDKHDSFFAVIGVFFIFIMPFIIRVMAEILVILFKIYEKLKLISMLKAKKLERANGESKI